MSRYQQLSQDERYTISALRGSHHSDAQVARALHRSPSTISRELRRNRCAVDGAYRLEFAHDRSVARRKRVHRGFRHSPRLWRRVVALLKKKWSPGKIIRIQKFIFWVKRQGILRINMGGLLWAWLGNFWIN